MVWLRFSSYFGFGHSGLKDTSIKLTMTLQVSMLKPSVLMSVPVEETGSGSLTGEQTAGVLKLEQYLTFGDDLIQDSPELHCRDLHVLKHRR